MGHHGIVGVVSSSCALDIFSSPEEVIYVMKTVKLVLFLTISIALVLVVAQNTAPVKA
jgi:hypothetical protein